MELNSSDRIFKTIDAKIGHNKFMRILSKIDKYNNITAEFYDYLLEDIDKEDGTVKNKRNRYITESISIVKFDDMVEKLRLIYPDFEIIGKSDYSKLTLKEAINLIRSNKYGKIIAGD
jgi:hypothetical protein